MRGAGLAAWLLAVGFAATVVISPSDAEVQRGTTAARTSSRISTPSTARPWTAEIFSEGAADLVITCDGIRVHIPAPGSARIEDDPYTDCTAAVLAPGPGAAQWTVRTRLEATK